MRRRAICELDTLVKEEKKKLDSSIFFPFLFFGKDASCPDSFLVNDLLTMVLWTLEWYCSFSSFFRNWVFYPLRNDGGSGFSSSKFFFLGGFSWSVCVKYFVAAVFNEGVWSWHLDLLVISSHSLPAVSFSLMPSHDKKKLFEAYEYAYEFSTCVSNCFFPHMLSRNKPLAK